MSDQFKLKAQQARDLLNNETFQEFLRNVRERQKEVFLNSNANEVSLREEAHTLIRALDAIESELTSVISAEAVLDRKNKKPKLGV